MPKNICIFSDGTGQMGGKMPDQKLSNVYKLYRAMRPGPDSPINPADQVAFYDPGLGTEEGGGLRGRIRPILESAVGAGIDGNIIDCYEKIIAFYEPGDRVLLFGFSRGAYTVRALANVMNLCGIPTRLPDGMPVPRHGVGLRKIAEDAVKFVYSHGAGKPRSQDPYFGNREELGRRFRKKYACAPVEGDDVQGNVQPTFIGVFDTVASLQNGKVRVLVWGAVTVLAALFVTNIVADGPVWLSLVFAAALLGAGWHLWQLVLDSFKYFSSDPSRRLKFSRPADWSMIWRTGHFATWNKTNYDRWLDPDVCHARHAVAIDEDRADFPRVGWGSKKAFDETASRQPVWLDQVWFAGCHSDIGGSYLETESRLSDIALDWMVEELEVCVPSMQINDGMLNRFPDPRGLQHREDTVFSIFSRVVRWKKKPRILDPKAKLHPSVLERLAAGPVPQNNEVKPYRPLQLREHEQARQFYGAEATQLGHEASG